MTPDEALRAYEAALGTQEWAQVEPLMHPDVTVTFSSGAVHRGRKAVGEAFSRNFESIADERYALSDVEWVSRGEAHAVCTYRFDWSGLVDGKPASGHGRGTTVLERADGGWLVLAEHLGPGD
jgi:ketosteroid isomerase-like protein